MSTIQKLEEAFETRAREKWALIILFFTTATPTIFSQISMTTYVFMSATGDVRCDIPALSSTNWTNEEIIAISCPQSDSTEHCTMYNWNYSSLSLLSYDDALYYVERHTKPNLIKCIKYHYDEEFKSIVSEWNLVCDKKAMKSTVQFIVPVGKLFGAIISGLLADRFGRRNIFRMFSIGFIACNILCTFVPTYWLLLALRFLMGFGIGGFYSVAYTTAYEMSRGNFVNLLVCLINLPAGIGMVLLSVIAYFSNGWRELQLSVALPSLVLLIHCWVIPESIKWLINQGHYEKAWKILMKTPFGGIELEEATLEKRDDSIVSKIRNTSANFLQLFSTAQLFFRSLICFTAWLTAGIGYSVLVLNGRNLSVNEYIYIALSGLLAMPGLFVPFFLLPLIGRKLTATILYSCGAIALLAILVVPEGTPRLIVSIIGIVFVSPTYPSAAIYTSDLFPTSLRNSVIGLCVAFAQVGSMVAPYITDLLGQVVWFVPSTVCGGILLFAVLTICLLPETANKKIPETIEDLENAPGNMKVSFSRCCVFRIKPDISII